MPLPVQRRTRRTLRLALGILFTLPFIALEVYLLLMTQAPPRPESGDNPSGLYVVLCLPLFVVALAAFFLSVTELIWPSRPRF